VNVFGLRQHHKARREERQSVPQDETQRRLGPRAGVSHIRISRAGPERRIVQLDRGLVIRIAERGLPERNRLVAAALAD
jgi:hypothetical protein